MLLVNANLYKTSTVVLTALLECIDLFNLSDNKNKHFGGATLVFTILYRYIPFIFSIANVAN